MSRTHDLKVIHQLLNTQSGQVLMRELKSELDPVKIMNDNPLKLAEGAARRDVYKLLESYQSGERVNDG